MYRLDTILTYSGKISVSRIQKIVAFSLKISRLGSDWDFGEKNFRRTKFSLVTKNLPNGVTRTLSFCWSSYLLESKSVSAKVSTAIIPATRKMIPTQSEVCWRVQANCSIARGVTILNKETCENLMSLIHYLIYVKFHVNHFQLRFLFNMRNSI